MRPRKGKRRKTGRLRPRLAKPVILQVIPELGAGGAEPIAIDLAEAVVKSGGSALLASHGGFRVSEFEARGGRHLDLPVHTKNPYGILTNIVRLVHLIDMYDVDLVHVHSRAPAWSTLAACRLMGRPLVATYHGTYNTRGFGKRLYNSSIVRGDAVIACSRFIASHVSGEYGLGRHDIDIIPCGIDMATYDPQQVDPDRVARLRQRWGATGKAGPPNRAQDEPAGKTRIILLPARLTSWKGHRVFIEAMARVKAAGRHVDNWTAVLVGDAQGRQSYVEALEHRIRRLNLRHRVIFHGHEDDMPAAYLAADVIVSPAIEPEAFGRVPVEAQAMTRPIVTTNHGGPVETVRADHPKTATGWRVPPRNPKALSQAIEAALDLDLEAWQAMGVRGRENVQIAYALDTMTRDTLALYRRLIEACAPNSAKPARPAAVSSDRSLTSDMPMKESIAP